MSPQIGVSAGATVSFYKEGDIEIIENIGSEPEDAQNHNNIVGSQGSFSVHNDALMIIYFKTWADGGFSFWGTGYEDGTGPVGPQNYKIVVGRISYSLDEQSLDGCPENQIGNYSFVIPAVYEGEPVTFLDFNDNEILNIGSEPEDNENHNNIVGVAGNFSIHNDAYDATIYFKAWNDGGYSFWLTGYEAEQIQPSDYSIQVGANTYNFGATSLDGCPQNQTGNYTAEIPSVVMNEEVHFFRDDMEIIERIGSEPEDNENHNLITGVAGSFAIHNDAENVTVYFKTWDDGGYSFWATGYAEQAVLTSYVTIINGVEYSMMTNPEASLGDHQVAEYMSEEIALVELDQEISFMKDGSPITQIGTGSATNNNAVGNWEEGFHVRSDAINVTMYLKEYDDGGYDFFLTGYTDNYQMNIAGINYAMTENLDFRPVGNYVREFYVELESVEKGDYFDFTNNGADITDNMVIDSGMNNALLDGMGYTFHNDATDVVVYLKLTEDYSQHSLWITGFEFTEEYIYTVNSCPDWIRNNDCVVFAWTWSAGYPDCWVPVYFVDATTVKLGINYELDGFLLVRCISGTQQPNWGEHGNQIGRIYNQTDNITCSSGVYTYNSPNWRDY